MNDGPKRWHRLITLARGGVARPTATTTPSRPHVRPFSQGNDHSPSNTRYCTLLYVRRMPHWRAIPTRRGYQPSAGRWLHTDSGHPGRPSRHAQFYSDLVPAMIPVALLGSAVYLVRMACLPRETHADAVPSNLGPPTVADTPLTGKISRRGARARQGT